MQDEHAVIRSATAGDAGKIVSIAQEAYAMYVPRMGKKPFPMLDDYGAHIRDGHAAVPR